MAKLRMRAALSALAAGILITVGGCSESHPTVNSAVDFANRFHRIELRGGAESSSIANAAPIRAEKVIGPEGGTLEIPGGHSLTFPSGAVSKPTTIRARVDMQYVEVDLDPHGIQFPAGREPTLKLSYAGASTAGFRSLTIAYFDEAGRYLEDMRGVDSSTTQAVNARLPHFSRYALVGAN
jgi:hypothetical protein